ncbi:hypothetical protein AAC387_Pa05g0973 [Persea americana]
MRYLGFGDVLVENSHFGILLIYFAMKPLSLWVYEDTGTKGRRTKSAAERRALESSSNPFSFRTGFGKFGLET